MSSSRTVAALAAQMAAGSGDARVEFHGDAGELHARDLNSTLPRDGAVDVSLNASSRTGTSAPQKLRRTVSTVGRKDQMIQLKATVLDVLSLLQSMCDDGDNRMKALHRRIHENHGECMHELEAFDDNFVWLDEVGFDIPRVIREGKLALDTTWLLSFGNPVRTPEEHVVSEKFDIIASKLLVGKERDDMISDMRKEVTKPLFPFGDGNMPEMMLDLNQFTQTDIIGKTTAALNQSADALAELNASIAAAEEALLKCLQNEQMGEAEKAEAELLTLTEKRLELCVKRVSILSASDDKDGGALSQLDRIIRNPVVANLNEEKNQLKATILSDVRLLEADRIEKLRENDNTIIRYNNNVEKSKARIRENHAAQDTKWKELENLLAEIVGLDREGERLTRDHVLMTEIEQKRRQEHREYRQNYALHRQHLDDLLANTEAAINFTDELKHAMKEGKEKLIEARIEETLKDLLKRERRLYLDAFDAYGTKNQTDVGRNEKRMAALDRMLNDMSFVRKQCKDTGDDASTAYARRMNEMERHIRKARKAAEQLDVDFERHASTYVRLESTMLDALGDTIAHHNDEEPVSLHLRIQRAKVEQFRQFVDQVSVMTTTSSAAASEMHHKHEQMSLDASALKERADQRRAANRSLLSSRGGTASSPVSRQASPLIGSQSNASAADPFPPPEVGELRHAAAAAYSEYDPDATINVSAIDVSTNAA